jgi:hypothetical protein
MENIRLAARAFENVKDQIGFCGIYCGSCAAGNGAIIELTKKYEELVKHYQPEKWAPKDFDFKEFAKGLASIQTMSTCPGCRKGGGNSACAIRICALKRGTEDCGECTELIPCRNYEELERTNPKAKENLMKIRGKDRPKLIEQWIGELRTKWPHCVLFDNAT